MPKGNRSPTSQSTTSNRIVGETSNVRATTLRDGSEGTRNKIVSPRGGEFQGQVEEFVQEGRGGGLVWGGWDREYVGSPRGIEAFQRGAGRLGWFLRPF